MTRTHWDRPAHLIVADECRFGLTDVAGGHIISTVGDYRPEYSGGVRREIGFRRFYETMVFPDSGRRCEVADCCGGLPAPSDWGGVDFAGYQTEDEARAGHAAMVAKYREASS